MSIKSAAAVSVYTVSHKKETTYFCE